MITPTDKSPREFWVTEYKNGDCRAFDRPIHPELESMITKETHVIEHSAYLAVKQELDKAYFTICEKDHNWRQAADERDKLQQELEAARAEIENLSIKLQRTVNAAQSALLETTAWMGIPEKKRDNQISQAMENVKYCAEHDLRHQDISNLKNEYQKQLADALAQIKDFEIVASSLLENADCRGDEDCDHCFAEHILNKWRAK